MIAGVFRELYIKRAPRWIKCIKWQESKKSFKESQKEWAILVYVPVWLYIYAFDFGHGPEWLAIKKPKNKEELMEIKRDYFKANPYRRDYEIDQYWQDRPPVYDTFVRRQKYPEHYGNKYDGHKRYI